MVDLIKLYLENIELSDYILASKFVKVSERDGYQYFKAKPDALSFLHEMRSEETPFDLMLKAKIVIQNEKIASNLSYKNQFISFKRICGETKGRLTIFRNVRKDFIRYKNLSPFMDLNFKNFIEIINLYADEFKVPQEVFWKAKVSQIELGVNVRFNMNITSIISSISKMKGVEKPFRIDNSTVNFRNQKYEVSIYDKLDRASQQNEVFEGSSKVRRRQLVKKIARRNSIVRFELRVKKVSQFNRSTFKSKIQSLEAIRTKFDLIANELYKLFLNISFIDEISPDIDRDLVKSQIKSKGVTAYNDFLRFLGLKHFGMVKFLDFASPILNTNIKNDYIQKLEKLYNSYKVDNDYVKKTFQKKVFEKLQILVSQNLVQR